MDGLWYENTTAVLLAGGQSSRMGSPKHLLTLDGEPFWRRSLRAAEKFPHIAVSVAQARPEFEPLPQWQDDRPGLGPVGALSTCLARAETPLVQFLTCDAPLVSEGLFAALFAALGAGDDCAVPTDGRRPSPLLGLYRKGNAPVFASALADGELRMRSVLGRLKVREVSLPPALAAELRNVNTPDDYRTVLSGRGETP